MWKKACDTAAKCISQAKEYNKQRYDKAHKEPDFREGDQVKNVVEVRLTEEFSRKHPVFPVSLVKPYHQAGENTFPSRNKSQTPQDSANRGLTWPSEEYHEFQEDQTEWQRP
ncbi:hypothetical protein O181_082953 [Austropuccinia psidii MF-1]|uniref:Uncharacterized protein n=1 Tax=Austropuccinia psidii MF-1 TaxID=1389203 RepID=A0A9Q3FSS3_9BASI|nr:hypothetical protein [Austropuccinia psidii MF-1]